MRRCIAVLLGLGALTAVAAPAASATGSLDMYSARVSQAKASQLLKKGWDISAVRNRGRTALIDVVLTRAQRNRLAATGVKLRLKRTRGGRTVRQVAAAQAAGGYTVYRSWDEPGGIRDELYRVARNNPRLVKLEVIGHSVQGREIIALKVTKNARQHRDGSRPAALYTATQHAREWISTEVNRRNLHWFIDRYKAGNSEIRKMLQNTELWFVVVANPDGYQYTFDHERLWRKTLRNNDSDPAITGADGVDPNRNFNEHWKYDNEGSSSIISSETFRGTGPASEPETRAMQGLIRKVDPETHSNFHSYGPLILFPQGWIVGAPDADNPIYTALGGTDANPAIPGFDPGLSAEELYVTNGETTDFADINAGALSFTPELEEGCVGCGFVFPDNEALIQAEFEKVLPFTMSLARSANNPANPETATGMTVKPFYLSQTEVDSENGALSMFDFKFKESFGDPQDVRVLAKRGLGPVTLKYRINGGRTRSASTSEWTAGNTYGVGKATYYRVMRGFVRGTDPGDSVQVWFEGGGKKSDSFTYDAVSESVSESGRRTLLLSAEDYTGKSGSAPGGPHYLSYYEDALTNNGVAYDVYDVDAHGRTAPDALGVLSHYDAVLWYTGDDIVVREQNQFGGTSSRLALQELYAIRDFMNEGGRVAYVGKNAGSADTTAVAQYYDPFENRDCAVTATSVAPFCRPLFGSGDGVNDVLEYWLGAGLVNVGAGANTDAEGNFLNAFDVMGVDNPFAGLNWGFNGPDSAGNQDGLFGPNSYITTSGLQPASEFPQFNSWVSARYDRPGGPFDPHTGDWYVHSQIADVSYKRLRTTVDVPSGGGTLTFWTSYNTEPHWDFLFVEAHTVGQDNWTTLPDQNGHTSNDTGDSCPEGWHELHPWLEHYQTLNPDGTCSPTGTNGGQWNAASGSSAGWQQWSIDLSGYANQQIEISISYASDWATQGLGVFLDDVNLLGQETSFEGGLDGWEVPGSPEGSAPNANDFERITGAGFPEGAAVTTDDSVLQGYGVEGITGQDARDAVIGRTMQYLLR